MEFFSDNGTPEPWIVSVNLHDLIRKNNTVVSYFSLDDSRVLTDKVIEVKLPYYSTYSLGVGESRVVLMIFPRIFLRNGISRTRYQALNSPGGFAFPQS